MGGATGAHSAGPTKRAVLGLLGHFRSSAHHSALFARSSISSPGSALCLSILPSLSLSLSVPSSLQLSSDDDDRGAYQPPRLAGHPSSGDDGQGPAWSAAAAPGSIFSPSQVNRGGGGVTHPSRVDPPSDDEEEEARRSAAPAAAARKRSTAEAAAASRDKGRDKSMPLLQDM